MPILVFLEELLGDVESGELELFDVEIGTDVVGRDGVGKSELKDLVREIGGFNCCENTLLEKRTYTLSGAVIINDLTANSVGSSDEIKVMVR